MLERWKLRKEVWNGVVGINFKTQVILAILSFITFNMELLQASMFFYDHSGDGLIEGFSSD